MPRRGKTLCYTSGTVKQVRYFRFTEEDLGLSAEDLLNALSDFLLESGFSEWGSNTLEDLKNALEEALLRGDFLDQERAKKIRKRLEQMSPEETEALLDSLVQKLSEAGYITSDGDGEGQQKVEFKVNDKGIDFLGYKTLKDLMGSLGRVELRSA